MDHKPQDDSSLTAPLLVTYESHQKQVCNKLGDIESNHSHSFKGTASSFNTIFNGLNALSGVGILSTPYALASGGWLSLILLFAVAIITFYTGLLIQRCMKVDSNIRSYPDIGECAFGNKGRILVTVFMYAELFLVATGFLILEGDNLHNIFPNTGIEIAGFSVGGKHTFVIIVALIVLPTVWLDNMSLLSYVSATGVMASVVILVSIFWTGAFEGIGFHEEGTLLRWGGIPTAVSLFAFCFCAHPVFPTLYTSMKHKGQFSNVLFLCFLLSTLSYASMAVFGYLMFGSKTLSQITLNLPVVKFSSRIAIYTTLVNPIAKYALMLTPIVNATKTWLPSSYSKKPLSCVVSTALVFSTVIVALVVPFFGYLMSFVGALLSVTASIILPCLCYLKISGTYRRLGCEMVILVMIIVLGVVVAALGTYRSVMDIITHL